jgi:hypothetical protein
LFFGFPRGFLVFAIINTETCRASILQGSLGSLGSQEPGRPGQAWAGLGRPGQAWAGLGKPGPHKFWNLCFFFVFLGFLFFQEVFWFLYLLVKKSVECPSYRVPWTQWGPKSFPKACSAISFQR